LENRFHISAPDETAPQEKLVLFADNRGKNGVDRGNKSWGKINGWKDTPIVVEVIDTPQLAQAPLPTEALRKRILH